jgi:MYXO-CTERM domain-containing protein
MRISKTLMTGAVAAVAVAGSVITSSAQADISNSLNLANARMTANSVSIGTVAGRSGVAILDSTESPGWANIWGTATGGSSFQSGFGMAQSGNSGVGGWAGSNGALLSDITGVSFDWYRATGGLGGGFRVNMYVYAPTDQGDISGYLLFDLSYLLPNQAPGQWNSTGNYLSGVTGFATYSADYGASQWSGYKSWADIKTALAGWSVYEIGIVNDAGYSAAVDNFTVTSVPAPGAIALLGAAGLVGSRRRR